jgi:hypothetical protein
MSNVIMKVHIRGEHRICEGDKGTKKTNATEQANQCQLCILEDEKTYVRPRLVAVAIYCANIVALHTVGLDKQLN